MSCLLSIIIFLFNDSILLRKKIFSSFITNLTQSTFCHLVIICFLSAGTIYKRTEKIFDKSCTFSIFAQSFTLNREIG